MCHHSLSIIPSKAWLYPYSLRPGSDGTHSAILTIAHENSFAPVPKRYHCPHMCIISVVLRAATIKRPSFKWAGGSLQPLPASAGHVGQFCYLFASLSWLFN
jgi:hypothetical protein